MQSQNAETLESFPPEVIARAAKLVREQMDREEHKKKIAAEGLSTEAEAGLYEVQDAGYEGFVYAKYLHPQPDLCGHHGLPGVLRNFSTRNMVSDLDRGLRLRNGDVIRVSEGCARPSDRRLRRLAPAEEIAAVPVEDAAVIADALDRLRTTEAEVAAASTEISGRKQRIEELQREILDLEAQKEKLATGVSARRDELASLFPERSKGWKTHALTVAEDLPGRLLTGGEWRESSR
jgi:hypothetical protein